MHRGQLLFQVINYRLPKRWMFSSLTSLVAQRVKHLSTMRETWVRSLGRKIPWRRKWQSTPVLLPGKSHGQRSQVGYSPWGRKESDTTEQLHYHYSFIGASQMVQVVMSLPANSRKCKRYGLAPWVRKILWGGCGHPLQCSCLENLIGRGAWRAIVHRVAKSWA